MVLEEELREALGTSRYERSDERLGYRNGHETRRITTGLGIQDLHVPRGRIVEDGGSTRCEITDLAGHPVIVMRQGEPEDRGVWLSIGR